MGGYPLVKNTGQGRLIALEGNGAVLVPAARQLYLASKPGRGGGVSKWDASGIFYELQRREPDLPTPSARILLLLYGADLAFRLRWELQPFLDQGKCVVAAPYVETAIAFGRAAGLSGTWLREFFRFAPKPHASYRIPGEIGNAAWQGKPSAGFLEFCCSALSGASEERADNIRTRARAYLDALDERCVAYTPKVWSPRT